MGEGTWWARGPGARGGALHLGRAHYRSQEGVTQISRIQDSCSQEMMRRGYRGKGQGRRGSHEVREGPEARHRELGATQD